MAKAGIKYHDKRDSRKKNKRDSRKKTAGAKRSTDNKTRCAGNSKRGELTATEEEGMDGKIYGLSAEGDRGQQNKYSGGAT